jgi:steroid 5-alpha reductase family enzyme
MLKNNSLQILNLHGLTDGTAFGHLVHLWVIIMLSAALVCFLVSELTRNYSQVDKLWSLMPVVYAWITLGAFSASPRLWLMALLVSWWGFRLSYNFYRKGGYHPIPWKGAEDYRWNVVRQHPKLNAGWKLTLFNFFFISLYQHLLILLFSSPLLIAAQNAGVGLRGTDYLAAFFMFLFIVVESLADNQQHLFQQMKRNNRSSNGKYMLSLSRGFLMEGLWSRVRHPNFAAEQAIWLAFYFFGVAASGQWINWTLSGALLLILLFMGSSALTESISLAKYPGYAAYRQKVPRFVPRLFRKGNF